jgi:hypothetical protein
LTRHELKELEHDPLAAKVGDALKYTSAHKSKVIRWAVVGLAVLVLAAAGGWYWNHAKAQREADLRDAFQIAEATVGKENTLYAKNFPTQQAKDDASLKAFSDVAAKDSGTKEGDIAAYYAAVLRNQKGDTNAAIGILKSVTDGGHPISSIAKVALANLYAGQGKYLDAETLMKRLVDRPTDLVSKEQAQIQLAQILGKHDPEAAKKLLDSIKPSAASSSGSALQHSIDEG